MSKTNQISSTPQVEDKIRADKGKPRGSYKEKWAQNHTEPAKSNIQPVKESFSFVQSLNAGNSKLDLSQLEQDEKGKEGQSEEIKQELKPLFDMFGSMFNSAFEAKTDGEPQKPQWTPQHTELWANSTSAILAKYGTGGLEKYTPELMLGVAIVNTVILAIQAVKYTQAHNAPKGVIQNSSGGSPLGGKIDKRKEAELDKLAMEKFSEIQKSVSQ